MVEIHLDSEKRPATVTEAFIQISKSLQQFGIERVRIEGLSLPQNSNDISDPCNRDDESVRTITEQQFMHEFVFHSRPCVILGALEDWPAMHRWRDDRYLFDLDGHLPMVPEAQPNSEEEDTSEEEESEKDMTVPGMVENKVEVPKRVNEKEEKGEEEEEEEEEKKGPMGAKKVTVALTPNGRADAVTYVTYEESSLNDAGEMKDAKTVTAKLFMCAADVQATLPDLYDLLRANPPQPPPKALHVNLQSNSNPIIAYAQMQNNCLATEYQHLHKDIRTSLDCFGKRVFGGAHEAANMWLGTPASVSSMHQDWVENLYAVVRGVKEFVLVAPWEGVFVPKPELPSAAFVMQRKENTFICEKTLARDGLTVPWMDVEITPAAVDDSELLPEGLRDKLHPLVAYVQPGEVLYLPAMWLHRVAQHADRTDSLQREKAEGVPQLPLIAAVNYWYDMSFTNPAVVMLREFGLLL